MKVIIEIDLAKDGTAMTVSSGKGKPSVLDFMMLAIRLEGLKQHLVEHAAKRMEEAYPHDSFQRDLPNAELESLMASVEFKGDDFSLFTAPKSNVVN